MTDIVITKGTDLRWYIVMTLGPFEDEDAAKYVADPLCKLMLKLTEKEASS